jgi:hypothetical protein
VTNLIYVLLFYGPNSPIDIEYPPDGSQEVWVPEYGIPAWILGGIFLGWIIYSCRSGLETSYDPIFFRRLFWGFVIVWSLLLASFIIFN